MTVQSVNPATEEVLASFEEHSERQVDEALDQSVKRSETGGSAPSRNAAIASCTRPLMSCAATPIVYARLITLEMGKPIVEAEAEVEKCAWSCDYYAENAEAFLADDRIAELAPPRATSPSSRSAPCWRSCPGTSRSGRSSASPRPALMAGNAVLLKHASNVPQCALAIEEVFARRRASRRASSRPCSSARQARRSR